MRVVHLCRVAPPATGGMEAVIDGLTALQREAGLDVSVLTTSLGPDGRTGWTTDAGVPVRALPRVGPRRWPFAWGLGRALQGVDLVHVHGIDGLADQALTLRGAGTRVGVSTHGGYLHTDRQLAIKEAWLRTGTPWSLRRADAIWFTSFADLVVLSAARLQGSVVPNGVALARFRAVRARRVPEPGRLLVLGRVDRHKGLDRLLTALAAVRARPWTLHVVGRIEDPALGAALREVAVDAGVADRVTWHGQVSDAEVDDQLARAWAAVFPSRHEGFGLALVQAQAAGVPCAVQPIAAWVDKVEDGETGVEVDFDAPGAGARLLDRLAGGAAWTEAAAAWAERFGWEAVAEDWWAAYAGVGVVPQRRRGDGR
ncbi:MAG: glycosyltransferase family 4 protein [Alphaproteobacteria bacterium]|nr:glycosyltransferase family 4 protein [Alphaproteobacteria bacterium]